MLLVLLGWFVRRQLIICAAATFCGATSRISLNHHATFLCSLHVTFLPSILSKSQRGNHTATAWKIYDLILKVMSFFHIVDDKSALVHMFASFSVDEIMLPKYVNYFSNFRVLPFSVELAPFHLECMKPMSHLSSCRSWYVLLLAPDLSRGFVIIFVVGIQKSFFLSLFLVGRHFLLFNLICWLFWNVILADYC